MFRKDGECNLRNGLQQIGLWITRASNKAQSKTTKCVEHHCESNAVFFPSPTPSATSIQIQQAMPYYLLPTTPKPGLATIQMHMRSPTKLLAN